MKPIADYAHFEALDIRVGRVIKVEDARSRKPTYRLTIDFGAEIGVKVSCGAYRNYAPEELTGKAAIAVVNFRARSAWGWRCREKFSVLGRHQRGGRDDLSDAGERGAARRRGVLRRGSRLPSGSPFPRRR